MQKSLRTLILAAVVFSPLLALVVSFGAALTQGHWEWLLLAVPSERRLGLLLRSLGLAAGVTVVDLVLGIAIACACWGLSRRLRWVRWLPLALMALPPYIHALAWNDIVQEISARLGVFRPAGEWLSGWVLASALLPVSIGLALVSLETVARPFVDAARIRQDDNAVLLRVVLPLAAPLLAAGAGLVFLLSLMDYTVPSLFGVNVYVLDVFAEFSSSHEPVRAFLLSIPLLLIAGGVLLSGQMLLQRAMQIPVRGESPWSTPPVWSAGFACVQKTALFLWGIQTLVPLVVLVQLSLRGDWLAALQPAVNEFAFSFGVAGAAALLSLPLSWLVLDKRKHPARSETLSRGWFLFPIAVPAPLVGIGLVTLWNHPFLDVVYDSPWMPVLAALARFTPVAAIVLLAQSRRVDPDLFDAAQVFQVRDLQTTLRIQLPLLAPGLIAAASLVFALTLGELGATLIVVPPGQPTLTLRIYNYLHYGASQVVAVLCLAMLLMTLAAGIFSALSLTLQSRLAAEPQ